MSTVFASLVRLFSHPVAARAADPVQRLLEQAGARAGRNPRQARELRQAAYAWLRVVR
jgi:hypothetical protein